MSDIEPRDLAGLRINRFTLGQGCSLSSRGLTLYRGGLLQVFVDFKGLSVKYRLQGL